MEAINLLSSLKLQFQQEESKKQKANQKRITG